MANVALESILMTPHWVPVHSETVAVVGAVVVVVGVVVVVDHYHY